MTVAELDLDLDVFAGPFDLLMAVVLREEVSLLEVELAEVVVAYVEHLERTEELELDVATEFLVLIAALLELKSRLMLPGAETDQIELDPSEAAEELLARLRALQRRGGLERPAVVTVGPFALDPAARELRRNGTLIIVTSASPRRP